MQKKLVHIIFFMMCVSIGKAEIINIPADFQLIQTGIENAADGDTILIEQGIYHENINFNSKSITLGSKYLTTQDSSFIVNTIIDGSAQGSVVILENVIDADAVLCGLTIQNGYNAHGGGIFCHNSHFIMSDVVLKECNAIDQGGAFYCSNSSIHIVNSIISNNGIEFGLGIFYCINSEIPMNNLQINDNFSWDSGCVAIFDSDISITNSTFENNYNEMMGAALSLDNVSGSIEGCLFNNNETSALDAGGIWIEQSEIDIMDCNITNNIAPMGSALSIQFGSNVSLSNSVISGNNSGSIYTCETILCSDSYVNIDDCLIENNLGGINIHSGEIILNNSDLINTNSHALVCNSASVMVDSCLFSIIM